MLPTSDPASPEKQATCVQPELASPCPFPPTLHAGFMPGVLLGGSLCVWTRLHGGCAYRAMGQHLPYGTQSPQTCRADTTYRRLTRANKSSLGAFPALRRKLYHFRINCAFSTPLNVKKPTPSQPEVTFFCYFTLWSGKKILFEQPYSITYYPSKS